MPVNFKRIMALGLRYWYLVIICLTLSLTIAFLINRYTTKIYAVTSAIIVREGTENAAAEFLYKENPLLNPYRNFYNELYIMRSFPLLLEVVDSLNFSVAWYREGNIKTSEIYNTDFPVELELQPGTKPTYGQRIGFHANDNLTYSLEYLAEDGSSTGSPAANLPFNLPVSFNGYKLLVKRKTDLSPEFIGKRFVIVFRDPMMIAREYAGRLEATWAEQGSSVVNLELEGPIPDKEIDFLRMFIQRYQEYDRDKKNMTASKSMEFLDDQLVSIGDSLKFFDNQIEQFKGNHFFADFDSEAQRIFERMEGVEAKLSELTLYENYFTYLEGYLKAGKEFDQIVPPSAVGLTDQVLSGLITQLTELQFRMRMLGSKQTEDNPLVVDRRTAIEQLKKDILEGIKSIRQTQQINRKFLTEELNKAEKQIGRLPQSERQMINIKRNYSIRENLYLFLLQKRAEAGISLASTSSDIIVVNPPYVKGGFITPKPLQNYVIASSIGLLLPLMIFFLLVYLNDKVQSKEDIEQLTTIPVIGGIGHKGTVESNLVVFNKPKSALAESFRALRSNLSYFTQGSEKKVILVTSSVSGEGKTFTTINLATAMAFSGKRVIIIGADMRKPRLYSDFNLNNAAGLSTYLSSNATLKEVVQTTTIENLFVMTGGPVPPNPSELLMLERTGELLKELLINFDYVLLDTPPLGLVSDAFSLVPFADHTIFMVRQNYTPRVFLRDLQELYEKRSLKKISIVFNDIQKTGPGYGYGYGYGYGGYGYHYGYGYGYGYGNQRSKSKTGSYYEE